MGSCAGLWWPVKQQKYLAFQTTVFEFPATPDLKMKNQPSVNDAC